ncbi:MAG: hypothetical protein JXK07_01000 [Spirochaetes bacterium]|nr:hypothetical protein [Spirochaetota bacterium]
MDSILRRANSLYIFVSIIFMVGCNSPTGLESTVDGSKTTTTTAAADFISSFVLTFRSSNLGPNSVKSVHHYVDVFSSYKSQTIIHPLEIYGFQEDNIPADHLVTALRSVFGSSVQFTYKHMNSLNLIGKGDKLTLKHSKLHSIGRDSWKKCRGVWNCMQFKGGPRYMLEGVFMYNQISIPFYTCHLSHDKEQRSQRTAQIKRLLEIIKTNAINSPFYPETVPVIVGDFNFQYFEELENYNLMIEWFRPIAQNGYDWIWVGKVDKFLKAKFDFQNLIVDEGVVKSSGRFDHNFPYANVLAYKVRKDEQVVHSIAPTGISWEPFYNCGAHQAGCNPPVRAKVIGGKLGTGAQWHWYTGPDNNIHPLNLTGETIQINGGQRYYYLYVRAEGPYGKTSFARY